MENLEVIEQMTLSDKQIIITLLTAILLQAQTAETPQQIANYVQKLIDTLEQ